MKLSASLIIFILLLSLGCAQQTTPTGGPQDSIPPSLIATTPPNKTTQFNARVIELVFDEFVNLNNPREQLLITPSIGKDFEATIRKKTVRLELTSELQDSTTYTINFRESVQDVTEKNPAQNLKYVFSTGSYLDSLAITGTVYELLSGQLVENASVALYHNPDTFQIFDHTPSYATRTDKTGRFAFENLKPDVYYVYAFNDKNNNLKIDSKTEKYGYLLEPITVEAGTEPSVAIPVISLDARELKLTSARPANTYFSIRLSKAVTRYSITPEDPADSVHLYDLLSPDQTTVNVYMPDVAADSLAINFEAVDSIGFSLDTLLYAKRSPRQLTPENFAMTVIESPTISSENYTLSFKLNFSKPVEFMNIDSIIYVIDSLHQVSFETADFNWINTHSVRVTKAIPDTLLPSPDPETGGDFRTASTVGKSLINEIHLRAAAFISIERDSSRNTTERVPYLLPSNTGTIIGVSNLSIDSAIFQLIDRDLNVIAQRQTPRNATFSFLPPGDYHLRLIHDQNGNGQWDPGNYFLKRQPEPAYFYRNDEGETLINLKVNWELGPLLITDEQPVDNSAPPTR